jgi:hypothetical protein
MTRKQTLAFIPQPFLAAAKVRPIFMGQIFGRLRTGTVHQMRTLCTGTTAVLRPASRCELTATVRAV